MKTVLVVALLVSLCFAAEEKGEFALLKDAIHEGITEQAARTGGTLLVDVKTPSTASTLNRPALIRGVRWNDMPDDRVFKVDTDGRVADNLAKLVWDLKMAPVPLRGFHSKNNGVKYDPEYDMSTVALPQRSHYFDYQHFHAMTPCKLKDALKPNNRFVNYRCKTMTNRDVLDQMLSQASEWFLKGCLNKVVEIEHDKKNKDQVFVMLPPARRVPLVGAFRFKDIWGKIKRAIGKFLRPSEVQSGIGSGVETGEFYLGNLLHMLEDSYSGAHAARAVGISGRLQEGPILFFQDYSAQVGSKHEKADVPSCKSEFEAYWNCAQFDIANLDESVDDTFGCLDDQCSDVSELKSSDRLTPSQRKCRSDRLRVLNSCYAEKIGLSLTDLATRKSLFKALKSKKHFLSYRKWNEAREARRVVTGALPPLDESNDLLMALLSSKSPEWAAAPGALGAASSSAHVISMFKEAVKASTISDSTGCEAGATKVVDFLKNVAMPLVAPDAIAGGTKTEYGGSTCPAISRVIENIGDYTKWDHSALTKLRDSIKTTVVFQRARHVLNRLRNHATARTNVDSIELTCVLPCKPVAGVPRVSPACVWWNSETGEYDLKCCIDIPDSLKFNQDLNSERNSRSQDAVYLRTAISGMGTDEAGIVNTLFRRSPDDIARIKYFYKKYYGKTLDHEIQDDTSGKTALLYKTLLNTRRNRSGSIKDDAKALWKAISGFGTDEDTLIKIIVNSSPARNRELFKAFAALPDNSSRESFMAAINGEKLVPFVIKHGLPVLAMNYLPSNNEPVPINLETSNTESESSNVESMNEKVLEDISALKKDIDNFKQ